MTNRFFIYLIFSLIFLKMVAIYFTEFSLYGDEAQYWLWSQFPDLGYYSKPPLLAWFLYGYTFFFGDSFISLKLFPILVYFFIFFAIYNLCVSLSLSRSSSWLCAFSFLVIPSASLSSFLISTDLLLLLFWTLCMVILLNIRIINSNYNFFLLGLFLGVAFLAKYAAIYFILSLLFLLIIDKKTLNAFKNNFVGSFFFILSFLIVVLPNVWWNINNDWVTLLHTSDNINLQNINLNLYEPLKFLGSQALMVGPLLFFFFVYFIKYFCLDFENKFLLIFSIPVFLIVIIESFLVRANANWAAPALISIFVLFFRVVNKKKPNLIKINFIFNYCVAVILFSLILFSSNNKMFDRVRGIDSFVKEVLTLINDKDLVISDRIVFSNMSYHMRNASNEVFMSYNKNMPVTNHFQISSPLNSERKESFYLIGTLNEISYLSRAHKGSLVKQFYVPFSSRKLELYEVSFK